MKRALWNWELPDWPRFDYNSEKFNHQEKHFLLGIGSAFAFLKNMSEKDYHHFVIEILSSEGIESSKIEGEILDRESLQSSIKKHFGLKNAPKSKVQKESQMAELLCSVYEKFEDPLKRETLEQWHEKLFQSFTHLEDIGKYRTHREPMQIISNRYDTPRVFFEAPPSDFIPHEMEKFIEWFNQSRDLPLLVRASVAHVYFESIHPFEDGNGRIGRMLVEKVLSQGVGKPTLIAVSKVLEREKKEYYAALEKCNRTLQIDPWIEFFSNAILQAQKESLKLLFFLIEKAKLLTHLSGKLNERQQKVLLRIFEEGLKGFKGGLSAENYISVAKTSRATATRDLNDLIEKGALKKTGELRHTRYYLNIQDL